MTPGLLAALGANVFGLIANVNFTYRVGYTVLPLLINFYANRCSVEPYFKSIAFFDWVAQDRTARARAEVDSYGVRKFMEKNRDSFAGLANKDGVIDIRAALADFQNLN